MLFPPLLLMLLCFYKCTQDMSIPAKPAVASTSVSAAIPNIPMVPPVGPNSGTNANNSNGGGNNGNVGGTSGGGAGTGFPMNMKMNMPMNMNLPMGMGMPVGMNMPMMPMGVPPMNMGINMNMNMGMNMNMPPGVSNTAGGNANGMLPMQNGPEMLESKYDPAIVMKQNQIIQQVQNKAQSRTHFAFEPFLNKEYNLGLDPDRPTCEYWIHSNGTDCPLGADCPLKHPSKIFKNKIVCKYWLRGLCKMGENCDFLHEYNLSRMPECAYYATNGVCTQSPECIYLHVDPQSKVPECWNYNNMGFCPDGPNCSKRHVRKVMCERYLAGFCPKGKDCEFTHPKFKLGLLHGRFKIFSDEELIGKRLKDKEDYENKIRLERDLKERGLAPEVRLEVAEEDDYDPGSVSNGKSEDGQMQQKGEVVEKIGDGQ